MARPRCWRPPRPSPAAASPPAPPVFVHPAPPPDAHPPPSSARLSHRPCCPLLSRSPRPRAADRTRTPRAGGSTGIAVGAYQTLRQPALPGGAPLTAKLAANRLLNSAGSLGRSFGNAAGALGLYFACLESALLSQAGGAVPDTACTVLAGFGTAALYRAPRGPRTAAVAGAVGAVAAAGLAALRTRFPSL